MSKRRNARICRREAQSRVIERGRLSGRIGCWYRRKQESGGATNTKQRSAEPDYACQTITAGRPATHHCADYECSGA